MREREWERERERERGNEREVIKGFCEKTIYLAWHIKMTHLALPVSITQKSDEFKGEFVFANHCIQSLQIDWN